MLDYSHQQTRRKGESRVIQVINEIDSTTRTFNEIEIEQISDDCFNLTLKGDNTSEVLLEESSFKSVLRTAVELLDKVYSDKIHTIRIRRKE